MLEKHDLKISDKADVEANAQAVDVQSSEGTFGEDESQRDVSSNGTLSKWAKRLYGWGVEARGSQPVPKEERVDMQFSKLCWVFFSSNFNILGFERFAWVPVLIAFLVAFGIGGKNLGNPPPPVPPTALSILGFAGVQAGFAMTWSGSATDFGSYLHHKAPSWKIFCYAFTGIGISTILMQSMGAAFVVAAQSVPAWTEGYAGGNIGGLLNAVFAPAGNFGKFLTVLLSLSVASNLISLLYSASIGFQVLIPALTRVPRYLLSVAAMGIVLPLAIVGAHRFYEAITNFMGLIGYWASAFSAIIIIEHVYFRSNNPDNYDLDDWNVSSRLPPGIAAVSAGVLTFGLVVPCMGQVLFTGPIAKVTGDIGFEVALILSALLYFPFRWLELRCCGR
ncbi:hypothetical protein CVT24_012248 [Panaeolus cyanescens]|uniref:Purine-cytosine permease n=1 Tax=Panaeolus cyanescens TaxID=181874 RepID=A0A409X2X9_9AGAR|nr:hypothetical protein CVT24_012248 [Panaeolus cyanescens]